MNAAAAREPGGWRLDRVAINVGDLDAAVRFYCEALGFSVARAAAGDPALAGVLGVRAARVVLLRRGGQMLELCACDPAGAPVPRDGRSNDAAFQHCALVVEDMGEAHARLCGFGCTAISRGGPVVLPGGIVAFKFRDPEGHPLELIRLPDGDAATVGGIDHSAICVGDVAASVGFYAARFGLVVAGRQVNRGDAQDALDDLDGVAVDVVALAPAMAGPHVELLGYRSPRGCVRGVAGAGDGIASRLVFSGGLAGELGLVRDVDGHFVLVDGRR